MYLIYYLFMQTTLLLNFISNSSNRLTNVDQFLKSLNYEFIWSRYRKVMISFVMVHLYRYNNILWNHGKFVYILYAWKMNSKFKYLKIKIISCINL